jgi:hypothetical protein
MPWGLCATLHVQRGHTKQHNADRSASFRIRVIPIDDINLWAGAVEVTLRVSPSP